MSKSVLITGASSGIGKAAVLYFAGKGWNVAATTRETLPDADYAGHKNIKQYRLDVTDQKTIESAIGDIKRDFGTIDVLVNNAGYGTVGAFEASTSEQVQQQFDVNVFGLMDLTREIIPVFRKQGHGHIINISSMGGRLAFPMYSVYHASKWAIDGFSESLMYELRPFNIYVKIIEPGLIKTQFTGRSEMRFTKKDLDAYDSYANSVIGGYKRAYLGAASADVVAATIHKAATSTSSKLRYVVGQPAPVLMGLRRILPERLFFNIIRRSAQRLQR